MKNFQAFAVAAAAIAMVATSAIPAAAAITRDPTGTTEAKDTQRVCIKETLSGSRVPRKICKTRAEWKAEGFEPK